MKNLFNVLGSIFIASTIVSCSGDSEETKSEITKNEVNEISVHEIDGTYDSEISRPTFTSVVSSYTTNRIPDSKLIGINNITITDKIICNAENSNICDEFITFTFFGNFEKIKEIHKYVKSKYLKSSTLIYKKDSKDNYLIVCKNQTCSNKIKTLEDLNSVEKNYEI